MIGVTLSRYFAWRFLRTILGIFLTIFCLMFVIVFVELLRRVSDNPQTGPGTVALMSIMRAPYSTEMILPFAVLFGSMATFVDLTRKLELVVARASGMSVWQFLAPPLLAAFFLGVFSVTVYNPVSTTLKQRSDQMEFDLFGVQGSVRIDHGLWLREHGVDGLSIVHATGAARGGAELSGVSVNVYTQDGQFIERVEIVPRDLAAGRLAAGGSARHHPRRAADRCRPISAGDRSDARATRRRRRAAARRPLLGLARDDRADGRKPGSTRAATACNSKGCSRGRCCSSPWSSSRRRFH